MAPRLGKCVDAGLNATVPDLTVEASTGAPPMTRTAAALTVEQARVKMKRRRINKSAVHRELHLSGAGYGVAIYISAI